VAQRRHLRGLIRSFADGARDGLGDVAGLRARLAHLVDLGVDALWITPWYPSPMKDGGCDVADYRSIDPGFGTMAEAAQLIADAHDLGLRALLDLVPNHVSDQHPWFRQWHDDLAAGAGGALAFARAPGFACVVSLSAAAAVQAPANATVLLASGALEGDGSAPIDTAA
jgi:hypothetical protein